MQVDVETEHKKTEILETANDMTESKEAMQIDSESATATTDDVTDKVEISNGVVADETEITASIEDCKKSKEIVIDVTKTETKSEESTPTVDAIEKDVVDEAVAVEEKKLDADEEDVDIKKSEPKVENNGDDASASVLPNGKDCELIEIVSNVETSTLIAANKVEPLDAPITVDITGKNTDKIIVSENDTNVVAIEMTADAITQIENGESVNSKLVDEKDVVMVTKEVENVTKDVPNTDPITETNATSMDTEQAPEVVHENSDEVSTKDATATYDEPIEAVVVTVTPVEEKPAESTEILSNGGSITDELKDVPIQVQHEVVSEIDIGSDTTSATATGKNPATTHMTEISEIVETISNHSKEKLSRVEITIEQIDKQLGQTTQTTTHIVKEISITEQNVCGKNIVLIVPTDIKKETVTNIDKKAESTEEKTCGIEKEVASINPETKVDSERGSHNGKSESSTNGNGKSENDSDKENDVDTVSTNCEDKLESSSLTADAVLKKCPETSKSTIAAASPVEA